MTRIIAGSARGRRLAVPGAGTRPTSDRVREALFSALQSALGPFAGVAVLDLYAGTGALGLEAASRGASPVLLVERDRGALPVLHANVAAVGVAGVTVRAGDVTALAASAATRAYDLVLVDPPYDLGDAELGAVVAGLAARGWFAPGARLVVERRRRSAFIWPDGVHDAGERTYGDTVLRHGLWYGPGTGPI